MPVEVVVPVGIVPIEVGGASKSRTCMSLWCLYESYLQELVVPVRVVPAGVGGACKSRTCRSWWCL